MKDVRILLAEGSEEALTTLDALDLSKNDMLLIVSDWLMPNINGEDLIKMIEQRWGPIMTIVLSGHITPEAKARLVDLQQVISVMNKPWDGQRLTQLITQSLMCQDSNNREL
jgi:DNA-binding NtrC family response regulator